MGAVLQLGRDRDAWAQELLLLLGDVASFPEYHQDQHSVREMDEPFVCIDVKTMPLRNWIWQILHTGSKSL
jgi:hypothetical protein